MTQINNEYVVYNADEESTCSLQCWRNNGQFKAVD